MRKIHKNDKILERSIGSNVLFNSNRRIDRNVQRNVMMFTNSVKMSYKVIDFTLFPMIFHRLVCPQMETVDTRQWRII